MTDKEILQKAIEKAKKNGFVLGKIWILNENESWIDYKEKIIFSHDFAKAFWGEEEVDEYGRTCKESWKFYKNDDFFEDFYDFEIDWGFDIPVKEAWEHHLQQMVIEENPLKYLEKFL